MLTGTEIVCDGCDSVIVMANPPRGWANAETAEFHICGDCWDAEWDRETGKALAFSGRKSVTLDEVNTALRCLRFPIKTFIGDKVRTVEDECVSEAQKRFGCRTEKTEEKGF